MNNYRPIPLLFSISLVLKVLECIVHNQRQCYIFLYLICSIQLESETTEEYMQQMMDSEDFAFHYDCGLHQPGSWFHLWNRDNVIHQIATHYAVLRVCHCSNSLLSDSQCGFRGGASTQEATLHVTNDSGFTIFPRGIVRISEMGGGGAKGKATRV